MTGAIHTFLSFTTDSPGSYVHQIVHDARPKASLAFALAAVAIVASEGLKSRGAQRDDVDARLYPCFFGVCGRLAHAGDIHCESPIILSFYGRSVVVLRLQRAARQLKGHRNPSLAPER